ncbi:MAG: phosphopantetheine-binding protein [Defluviimonas denitrificans]
MTDILARIKDALATVSGEDTSDITLATDIGADLDLDSILFVQFLLALEDGFPGLEFSQETLVEASFDTIGSVAAFIATMTGAEAGGEAAAA